MLGCIVFFENKSKLKKKMKFALNFEAHISESGSPVQNLHSAKYWSYVSVYLTKRTFDRDVQYKSEPICWPFPQSGNKEKCSKRPCIFANLAVLYGNVIHISFLPLAE